MSYTLWNIKVSSTCAMMVDMATDYDTVPDQDSQFAQIRDSFYILSVMNQCKSFTASLLSPRIRSPQHDHLDLSFYCTYNAHSIVGTYASTPGCFTARGWNGNRKLLLTQCIPLSRHAITRFNPKRRRVEEIPGISLRSGLPL